MYYWLLTLLTWAWNHVFPKNNLLWFVYLYWGTFLTQQYNPQLKQIRKPVQDFSDVNDKSSKAPIWITFPFLLLTSWNWLCDALLMLQSVRSSLSKQIPFLSLKVFKIFLTASSLSVFLFKSTLLRQAISLANCSPVSASIVYFEFWNIKLFSLYLSFWILKLETLGYWQDWAQIPSP